jgi:hypothetical protein
VSDRYYERYKAMTPYQQQLHKATADYGESCAKLGRELQAAGVERGDVGEPPSAVSVAQAESSGLWHALVELIAQGEPDGGEVPG